MLEAQAQADIHGGAMKQMDLSPSSSSLSTSRDLESNRKANAEANVKDDYLDLSRKQLKEISKNFKVQYLDVKRLNLSHNGFHSIKGSLFPNCVELNISYNLLDKISSLGSLSGRLKQLDASHNDIINIDGIQNFLRLECLNLAGNALKSIPTLNIFSLKVIDLSENCLPEVPDFSQICNLETLNLSKNPIKNLKQIASLPKKLKSLGLASIEIEDISQLVFLHASQQIIKFDIYPLEIFTDAPFNYKHLILCLLPSLNELDGKTVDNKDLLCGEQLLLHGNLTKSCRKFVPGGGKEAHKYVWNYLCEMDEQFNETKVTPLRNSLIKALEMKEQYEKSTPSPQRKKTSPSSKTEDEFSVHSPFADWSKHMGKENTDPETDISSPISTRRIDKNVRIIETGRGRRPIRRSGSVGSRFSQMSNITNNEETPILSGTEADSITPIASERSPQPSKSTKSPAKTSVKPMTTSEDETDSVTPHLVTIQHATPRSRRKLRSFNVAEVTPFSYQKMDYIERIQLLENKMAEMFELCDNLSKTNQELSGLLIDQQDRFTRELNEMQKKIDELSQPPKPIALSICKRGRTHIEIKWEIQHVKGYNVFINGQKSGMVQAAGRIARISELEENKEHSVQLQAISLDGVEGPLSEPLLISPQVSS